MDNKYDIGPAEEMETSQMSLLDLREYYSMALFALQLREKELGLEPQNSMIWLITIPEMATYIEGLKTVDTPLAKILIEQLEASLLSAQMGNTRP